MADRKCSYCGTHYTDEMGHNYDTCVKDCERRVAFARRNLLDARRALKKAKKIQVLTFWGRIKVEDA